MGLETAGGAAGRSGVDVLLLMAWLTCFVCIFCDRCVQGGGGRGIVKRIDGVELGESIESLLCLGKRLREEPKVTSLEIRNLRATFPGDPVVTTVFKSHSKLNQAALRSLRDVLLLLVDFFVLRRVVYSACLTILNRARYLPRLS